MKPSSKLLYKQKLWIFHRQGLTIFAEGCEGLLYEIEAQDLVPINGMPLCGSDMMEETSSKCSWSENAVISDSKVVIGQPDLNQLLVFDSKTFQIVQIIATDPRPMNLWLVRSEPEDKIWLLCHGRRDGNDKHGRDSLIDSLDSSEAEGKAEEDIDFGWDSSSSREQQRHNRKSVQIVRLFQNGRNHDISSLQPVDKHHDLVYNLFIPQPSTIQMHHSHDKMR